MANVLFNLSREFLEHRRPIVVRRPVDDAIIAKSELFLAVKVDEELPDFFRIGQNVLVEALADGQPDVVGAQLQPQVPLVGLDEGLDE